MCVYRCVCMCVYECVCVRAYDILYPLHHTPLNPYTKPTTGDQDAYIRTHKLEAKWMTLPYDNVYYGFMVNASSSYNGGAFNYTFAVGMLYGLSTKLVQHIYTSDIAKQEKVCVCGGVCMGACGEGACGIVVGHHMVTTNNNTKPLCINSTPL